MKGRANKGFTLIELLVVISIIGMMSSVLLVSIKDARDKGKQAKYILTMHSFQVALEQYFNDNGHYPEKSSTKTMVVDNCAGNGWPTFLAMISQYFPAATTFTDVACNIQNNLLTIGIQYRKGSESTPVTEPMYNGKTGQYLGCITSYEGYYLDITIYQQSAITLNDNGADPDGIDHFEGHAFLDTTVPLSSCPITGVVF